MQTKVLTENGILFCSHCNSELLCNDCGDMPETCPSCGVSLDWSDYTIPAVPTKKGHWVLNAVDDDDLMIPVATGWLCSECGHPVNLDGKHLKECPHCGIAMDVRSEPATITSGQHTFTVVEEVPLGYEIWNIGKHMVDGYLPFCRILPGEGRRVEIDTLKAIKTEGAQTILAAIGAGHKTIDEMEAFIEENQFKDPSTWEYHQAQRMREALPFMRRLRWPN